MSSEAEVMLRRHPAAAAPRSETLRAWADETEHYTHDPNRESDIVLQHSGNLPEPTAGHSSASGIARHGACNIASVMPC